MLVKVTESKKEAWSSYLDTCVFAYNTSRHESSKFSPFELMFGRRATLPIDIELRKAGPEEMLKHLCYARQWAWWLCRVTERTSEVLRGSEGKHPCCTRKTKILKILPKGTYLLQLVANSEVVVRVTGSHLKPYNEPAHDAGNEPPLKKSRTESSAGDGKTNNLSSTSDDSLCCLSPAADHLKSPETKISSQTLSEIDSPGYPKACSTPNHHLSSSLLHAGNTIKAKCNWCRQRMQDKTEENQALDCGAGPERIRQTWTCRQRLAHWQAHQCCQYFAA